MLELKRKALDQKDAWAEIDVALPKFDIDAVQKNTVERPTWIHFGAGNIFRGFVANAYQKVLNKGLADTGIVAVDSFDFEVIDKVYTPFDNLTMLVLMKATGEFEKTVVGSIVEAITTDPQRSEDFNRLTDIFENPSLQMVSFTITEKGYAITTPDGEYIGVIKKDLESGIEHPIHTMSIITAFAYKRFKKGGYPLTFVSMDNCSHNGDKVKAAVHTIADEWLKRGYVEQDFIDYIKDESKVTFPLSMIDKITPRPSQDVQESLEKDGLSNMDVIITDKNSYMAPFVNAEISEYLVIEDKFTNGRPKLEEAGVIFTDRETVNRVETMKVTTCLNPLHTALAVTGCLLGYTLIADEVKDPILARLINKIGYEEGLKVVVNPGIIDPKEFIDEVVNERFANPFIPDTPQRIATDTSQKVGIRFGETIKSYAASDTLDPKELTAIPLALAAWVRYLLGVDDKGQNFDLSSDPLMEELQKLMADIQLGDQEANIKPLLEKESIFGLDLYSVGLGEKIEGFFLEMLAGPGAVRNTLEKYLK